MKAKILNTLGITTGLLLCAVCRAQTLIYSNSFINGNTSVSVYETPPTYATSLNGASSSAVWICTVTNPNPAVINSGTVYQGGNIGTNQGCALLPLAVQTNAVYILGASVNLGSPMASDIEMGFTATNTSGVGYTNYGFCRFNDNPPNGYAWDFLKTGATPTFFGGPKTSASTSGGASTPVGGAYNLEIILNTLNNTNLFSITNVIGHAATNYWVSSSYINGVQVGTNIYYASGAGGAPPFQLEYCGIGQATFLNDSVSGINWNYFTVSTPLAPIITKQPASGATNQGLVFTTTVLALADTNGGTLAYQWYTNGIPLSNGGNISGVTNASLTINGVLPVNDGTNYYVVVTNTYGAVTSSPASLLVYSVPQFTSAYPITYTNVMSLYGGTNTGATTYYGSSPSFSVTASGASPIFYQWYTNGVAVGGATNTSFTVTNCQMTSPTNFACVASNFLATMTNEWSVAYLAAPTTPFQQAVLASMPLGYWRLNEPDCCGGNGPSDGLICNDYESANNGIYTNVNLGQASGYSPTTDPAETSALFGTGNYYVSSDANSIGGNNIDFSGNSNAEYTVALWANGSAAGGVEPANGGLFTKGYFSAEEFSLDCAPSSYDVRLTLRNRAGTQYNAISSLSLGTDPNWHFITGVCDESNGIVSLYIDGALAARTSIPPGSGIINSASTPMMIGARSSTATSFGDNQFEGNLNDVAVYGYAMTPSQITQQYQAAGYNVAPYLLLLAPLPPTNIVFQTNTTVTISATAFGTPPIGYYWTNVTTATVIASGTTNALQALNATLTLPDISSSFSGNQLELVVTNAGGSTNWFVNLTGPTPLPSPQTLGYTNSIIYSNSFFVGAEPVTMNGLPSTAANILAGGTNSEWICTYTNAGGSNGTVYATGAIGTNDGCALVPFTPEPGFIYTMTASLTASATMGNWVAMGFTQLATQNNNPGTVRFTDDPPNGYAWMYVQNANAFFEPGPRTTVTASSIGGVPLPSTTPVTLQVILNTVTNDAWTASTYLNGVGIGTNYYNSTLPIGFAGIGQNQFATSLPNGIQWNYWTLSQVSPNGFPPYLLAPLPPASILLTNTTISIPAAGYGTGPWGYYWSNNSTVIASGATNNTAPDSVALSVPASSLSAGQLDLVLTNALGTNITSITLVSPKITLSFGVTNGNLYLSWPSGLEGLAQLQGQTNSVGVGLSNNWVNVAGSLSTNQFVFPINLTSGTVFYRLTYAP